jgi:hypothetical protein
MRIYGQVTSKLRKEGQVLSPDEQLPTSQQLPHFQPTQIPYKCQTQHPLTNLISHLRQTTLDQLRPLGRNPAIVSKQVPQVVPPSILSPRMTVPADSDLNQVKPVVKPSRMTLEEAERILDKKWKDYLVDKEIYPYKDEVSPGVVRYGITHLAKPWMDYKDSWDGLVEYWGNQCDDWWQQGDKEKAALAVCIMYSVKSQQELERRKEECEKTFRTVYKYAQGRG